MINDQGSEDPINICANIFSFIILSFPLSSYVYSLSPLYIRQIINELITSNTPETNITAPPSLSYNISPVIRALKDIRRPVKHSTSHYRI